MLAHLAEVPRSCRVDRVAGRTRQPVQPHPEERPVSPMVSAGAGGGQRGARCRLGFGDHRTGRLGDLDHHPAGERHRRLAMGQHPQADQGNSAPCLVIANLVGDGHGRQSLS
jgi:hypothetical protein